MLRAMLVDDEPLALEGLRLLVDWHAEGFAICAECAGAIEALAALPKAKPDLIVTDIRMPDMDGLALLKEARARGFGGQFVVVSGYGDFDYARRALRIGVAGYLLKPIEQAEAASVLEHVREMLVSREAGETELRAQTQRALTLLLGGQKPVPDTLPTGFCWRLGTWGAPLPFEAVREVQAAFAQGAASVHIVADKEYLVLRWPVCEAEPSWQGAEAVLARLGRRLRQSEMCETAELLPAQCVALAAQLEANADALAARVDDLVRAIALRNTQECVARSMELDTLLDACGVQTRSRVRMRLVSQCSRHMAHKPEALATFLAVQDADMHTLSLLAIRLLAPVQAQISDRVAAYVENRLAERLTLESVAEALSYNATYLGRVFREERGRGFREWLNDRRVERAASLLLGSDATVNAVAELVGYQHYKRFLAHFKRLHGVTPEQYRKHGKA